MYSFAQRPDTAIVDEPLYGHFLHVSGAEHPGRDEVIQSVDCDGSRVMRRLLETSEQHDECPVLFMKQMAHHLVELDTEFLQHVQNVFLIRDPHDMLPSLTIQLPNATLADTGLQTQFEIFDRLRAQGQVPAIIDSRQLLLQPRLILERLCRHIGIPFFPEMLEWPAGPRSEDGVWARHWYHAVHQSTGFSAYRKKDKFPDHLIPLLNECLPFYEHLYAHAFKADE